MEKGNTDLPWDDSRLQLLESLIRQTARFAVALNDHFRPPSIMYYDAVIKEHKSGSCNSGNVRGWVYVSLLRKAVQDANAVALLSRESLWSQALNLWRSLFQTDVICQYIAANSSRDHLACRYVMHSIIRSTVLRWQAVNETCTRLDKPAEYSAQEIERRKDVFRKHLGKWRGGGYAWTGCAKHRDFRQIAESVDADMLFYQIANNEVHPTFGDVVVATGLRLPLPAIPLLPIGITHSVGEMSLEFQTAKVLSDTTQRVTEYVTLRLDLQDTMTTLKELSDAVLRDLA